VHFEILERDGLARVGVIDMDGEKRRSPLIAHIDTDRYHAPEGSLRLKRRGEGGKSDLLIDQSGFVEPGEPGERPAYLNPGYRGSPYGELRPDGDLAVIEETAPSLLDSKKFIDSLLQLKHGHRLLQPAFCSVMGLPNRLAFLSYCGFDIFDSLPLIMAAENGGYLTGTGTLDYGKIEDLPCSCSACASGRRGREELLQHNYRTAEIELRLVRHTISEGRLRELVESRIRSDPWLVQNLRLLDLQQYELQEMHTPIKGAPFHAGSKESLTRPDIVRWRKRLEQRYKKPARTKVLLLIPCSARKPYSLSQSHARFRQAIWSSGNADVVHEVIVTSPLGLVPRELELFYPAQDYDIPVTGHWDLDEKRMAEEMVSWLVSTQKYDLVISHLADEREPVNSVLKDFVDTSLGHPGSRESLRRLEDELRDRVSDVPMNRGRGRDLEDMRSLCRFQFGQAGEALCDDAKIVGRWPNLKILRGQEQLGMLTGDRGMISLTLEGAKVLAKAGTYSVEIEDFKPKGNLFAVGVEKASPEIRIRDDVAVVHKGDVRAVGVAMMSPTEMELAQRGEAVHIRHAP
jgi:archaeosine synthase